MLREYGAADFYPIRIVPQYAVWDGCMDRVKYHNKGGHQVLIPYGYVLIGENTLCHNVILF